MGIAMFRSMTGVAPGDKGMENSSGVARQATPPYPAGTISLASSHPVSRDFYEPTIVS